MRKFAIMIGLATFLAACGGDENSDEEHVDEEGCEHLQEGPETAVTAAADATGAPAIDDDHRRYDVTLVEVTGGNGGTVSFAAASAGDHVFFMSANVPVAFATAAGAPITIKESATSSTFCTDIRARHVVTLAVGTVNLTLGPTSETAVSFVVEPLE